MQDPRHVPARSDFEFRAGECIARGGPASQPDNTMLGTILRPNSRPGTPGPPTGRITTGKCKSRAEMRVTVVTAPGQVRSLHSRLAQRHRSGRATPVPPGDTVNAHREDPMRSHTAACLTALALLAGAGCAGSARRDDTAGSGAARYHSHQVRRYPASGQRCRAMRAYTASREARVARFRGSRSRIRPAASVEPVRSTRRHSIPPSAAAPTPRHEAARGRRPQREGDMPAGMSPSQSASGPRYLSIVLAIVCSCMLLVPS